VRSAVLTVASNAVGTVVVDLFNARDKRLVFRGVGQEDRKGREKMFKNSPPYPKE
jgi:hypothetical protein